MLGNGAERIFGVNTGVASVQRRFARSAGPPATEYLAVDGVSRLKRSRTGTVRRCLRDGTGSISVRLVIGILTIDHAFHVQPAAAMSGDG